MHGAKIIYNITVISLALLVWYHFLW